MNILVFFQNNNVQLSLDHPSNNDKTHPIPYGLQGEIFSRQIRVGPGGRQGHGACRTARANQCARAERHAKLISVRDGTGQLSPSCRTGPPLVLAALKYHSLPAKIHPLNSGCFREYNIMRFQAKLANTNPYSYSELRRFMTYIYGRRPPLGVTSAKRHLVD